jgi:geranylgeranyl diphosphate synthase, type I
VSSPRHRLSFDTGVEDALDALTAVQYDRLSVVSASVEPLIRTAREFTRGGKRLRARFCHAGWQIAGGRDNDPRIVRAAAAFEWLQASALVHDDLMDGSDTRRGEPSVHRFFEQQHRESPARVGDAVGFGEKAAVLVGDLLLSWADEALRTAAPTSDTWHLDRALALWDAAKAEVIAGQFLDVVASTQPRISVDEAMTILTFKAAKYTVERPLQIGAALAGGDDGLLAGLSEVALPLGAAFQLRDDQLGVFGDPAATGKPAGDDLREGKRTVLVARAAELTPPSADRLFAVLGTADGVGEATAIISASGAAEMVEQDIDRLREAADAAAAALGPKAQQVLAPLITAAVHRDR